MPLDLKPIGTDRFEEILAEALARIPVHTPEWTHFNESDPGTTLVELFAFMTESLLYRANRIPERNRQKFLQLLRLGLRPATPATGFVVFDATRGPLDPDPLDAGTRLEAGDVPFRTLAEVSPLPVDRRVLYKAETQLSDEELAELQAAYEHFRETDVTSLRFYETKPFPVPEKGKVLPALDLDAETVDRSVWIALLAPKTADMDDVREAIGGRTLSVGVMPVRDDRVVLGAGSGELGTGSGADVEWEISTDRTTPGEGALPVPRYEPLEARAEVDVLREPGVVHLTLPGPDELRVWKHDQPVEDGAGDFPPRLEEDEVRERLVAWIRMRFRSTRPGADLHWIDVNAARIRQGVLVEREIVGRGSGEPDQAFSLAHTPLIEDTLLVEVEEREPGGTVWTPWEQVTDFLAHDRAAEVYTVDREAGEIRFGDGIHGHRPPSGRRIRASYEFGGGTDGNVPLGSVTKGTGLPAGVKVTNPVPSQGGAEAETVEEGERRIPEHIRHRERAVTREDFEDVVDRTPGVHLGRREVLPLFHPKLGDGVPGVVTLLVIPREDRVHPRAPRPDSFFLRRVAEFVEPRRLITTEVHVLGPCYVPVWVSVGVRIRSGYGRDGVIRAVRETLETYLSPVRGGPDGDGWPLGKTVLSRDLEAQATRVPGVEFVEGELLLATETARGVSSVELAGIELPEVVAVAVTEGEAHPIDQVVGDKPPPEAEALENVVSVPLVPEVC